MKSTEALIYKISNCSNLHPQVRDIWILTQNIQSEAFNKNQEANDTTIDIMIIDHVTKFNINRIFLN